ncbi:hypothetical protein [Halobacillus sp. B29]|uniref:hypothetical protein n=1 Tax=Halobacillus sp. B29 TaxID=3457432 RepID=UPI003FCED558
MKYKINKIAAIISIIIAAAVVFEVNRYGHEMDQINRESTPVSSSNDVIEQGEELPESLSEKTSQPVSTNIDTTQTSEYISTIKEQIAEYEYACEDATAFTSSYDHLFSPSSDEYWYVELTMNSVIYEIVPAIKDLDPPAYVEFQEVNQLTQNMLESMMAVAENFPMATTGDSDAYAQLEINVKRFNEQNERFTQITKELYRDRLINDF